MVYQDFTQRPAKTEKVEFAWIALEICLEQTAIGVLDIAKHNLGDIDTFSVEFCDDRSL